MGGKKNKEVKEKPLEKMTAKELRETALKIPEISGVHGMNKSEIISEIKKSRGIVDDKKSKTKISSVRDIKAKIKKVKAIKLKADEQDDKKMSKIYRKKISRLKKQTRKAA